MNERTRHSRATAVISATIVMAMLIGGGWLVLVSGFSGSAAADEAPVHDVTTTLTNLYADAPASVDGGSSLTVTLSAQKGYLLPETVTVTMGGVALDADVGYQYSAGVITIDDVTGDILITADGILAHIVLLRSEEGASFELYFDDVLQYVLTLGATGLFPISVPDGAVIEMRGIDPDRYVVWVYGPDDTEVRGDLILTVKEDINVTATFVPIPPDDDPPVIPDAGDSEGGGWYIIGILLVALLFYALWLRSGKHPSE